jgi:hypothetical protein
VDILGNQEDALITISRVPDGKVRKEIISANILQELGKHNEAIDLYEKGISVEPDFYLPYARLLESLRIEGRPTYEFWLYKTIKKFPESITCINIVYLYQYINRIIPDGSEIK